jgi:hypothetical protein
MKNIIFILLLLITSCGDNLQVTEKDLEKYPEIQSFLFQIHELRGVHNIDLAILDFSYLISKPKDSVFLILDSVAKREKWIVYSKDSISRVYTKYIQSFPADEEIDSLIITYNNDEKRIYYRWK